ncbi:hypothetical protein [Echinicola sp. 20G]|uniref:hypothetical protein n=1 Tax=Echinicola sp. 20G TaxID=2781961 RepID=UPI0019110656|nr:hypothetical protein [Echinicola sp. 20G]
MKILTNPNSTNWSKCLFLLCLQPMLFNTEHYFWQGEVGRRCVMEKFLSPEALKREFDRYYKLDLSVYEKVAPFLVMKSYRRSHLLKEFGKVETQLSHQLNFATFTTSYFTNLDLQSRLNHNGHLKYPKQIQDP